MNKVHLQGIGNIKGIKAEELKVGMVRVYNYGYISEVVAIAPKGKASLAITVRNEKGEDWTAITRRSTLVAVK